MDQRIESFLADVLALPAERTRSRARERTRDHRPWRKSLWGFAGNRRSGDHPHRPLGDDGRYDRGPDRRWADAGVWRFGVIDVELSALNAALVRQGNRRLPHRPRRQWAGARLRLFRGGAGPTRGFGHFQTRRSGRLRSGQRFHVAKPVAVPSCQLTSVVAAKVLSDPLIPLYFPVPPVYSKVPVQCTVSPSHFQVT